MWGANPHPYLNRKRGHMKERRFKEFTNIEVYMLSRQAIESSWNIVMEDRYNKDECKIHNDLMNELIEERKIRDYVI